jgi:hypothetical protein
MLQPVYTMHGFNWFDRRGTEGIGFVRTLRTLLTNNLPRILPGLSLMVKTGFDDLYEQNPIKDGMFRSHRMSSSCLSPIQEKDMLRHTA